MHRPVSRFIIFLCFYSFYFFPFLPYISCIFRGAMYFPTEVHYLNRLLPLPEVIGRQLGLISTRYLASQQSTSAYITLPLIPKPKIPLFTVWLSPFTYLDWFVTIHLIEGVFFPRTKKLSPKVIPVSFIDSWSLVLFEAISFLNLIQLNISEFYNVYFVKCCLSKPTWFIIISWMSRASTM